MKPPRLSTQVYSLLVLTLLTLAIIGVAFSPPETSENGGSVLQHKILYIHLPAAAVTLVACMAVFVTSVGHLLQHRRWWDDMAQAAGMVAVVACTALLATGMIWGKKAWGEWWTWSPRLTFSLVLWALYAGFLGLRPLVPSHRRAQVSSVYGIIAFLDVPLVYMSTKLLPDVHPASIPMDAPMKRTLLLCTVAALVIAGGFVAGRITSRWSPEGQGKKGPPIRSGPLRAPPPTVAHERLRAS